MIHFKRESGRVRTFGGWSFLDSLEKSNILFRLLLWFSCESLLLFDHMVLAWTKFIMFTAEQLIWISSQLDIKYDLELEALEKVP